MRHQHKASVACGAADLVHFLHTNWNPPPSFAFVHRVLVDYRKHSTGIWLRFPLSSTCDCFSGYQLFINLYGRRRSIDSLFHGHSVDPRLDKMANPIHASVAGSPLDHKGHDACQTETSSQSTRAKGNKIVNYSYTDSPLTLMGRDALSFFANAKYLPNIVNPLTPTDSGDMCELAFTRGNFHCLFLHTLLIFLQLGFILAMIPMTLLLPLWMTGLFASSFWIINLAMCRILNGPPGRVYKSNLKFALEDQDQFKTEKWFFLNGVAVGEHWLQNALDRLALTFGRQVTGVHNQTNGIIFDTIECLIQRDLGYVTSDIRTAYRIIENALYDRDNQRVILILHSQGGIEGGMVLDWLLQGLPQNIVSKLEIYTFGNAANHFNNPYTSVEAKAMVEHCDLVHGEGLDRVLGFDYHKHSTHAAAEPLQEKHDSFLPSQRPLSPPDSPLFDMRNNQQQQHRQDGSVADRPSHVASQSDSPTPVNGARVLSYIEHYAFDTDFVAEWGVLHFANGGSPDKTVAKFVGRLFSRTDGAGRGGHQFVQHYLDRMFPLRRDHDNNFSGCKQTNEFVQSVVKLDKDDREGERYQEQWCSPAQARAEDRVAEKLKHEGRKVDEDEKHRPGKPPASAKVWELSRLWGYRNGGIPRPHHPYQYKGKNGNVYQVKMQ